MTTDAVPRSTPIAPSTPNAAGEADAPLSIDELDRAIVNLAGRINAATYDFLVLIRRFDERAGWLAWSFESCAEWLHWRCDICLNAAREKVRVAHALKTLPAIGRAFAEGRLSYSKVRALTRVAGPSNEDELLTFALGTTAARVEERCRELRYGSPASTAEALRAHARRMLSLRRDPVRGTVSILVELPQETGELVDKALDRALEASASDSAELAGESWAAQRADALVALAKAYLGGRQDGSCGTKDHYQVTVHVEESALRGEAGRAGLPIETVRRIACDCDLVVLVEGHNGDPLRVGRKTRSVPAAIYRALWARDKGCRFPGCGRTRFVDAHHIEHWANGGEHSLENLILLCSRHHALVHEGGFTIEKDYADRWFFRRPDGRAVPACGYRPEDMSDDGEGAAAEYFDGYVSAGGSAVRCCTALHTSAETSWDTIGDGDDAAAEYLDRHASAEASEAVRCCTEAHTSAETLMEAVRDDHDPAEKYLGGRTSAGGSEAVRCGDAPCASAETPIGTASDGDAAAAEYFGGRASAGGSEEVRCRTAPRTSAETSMVRDSPPRYVYRIDRGAA